METNQTSSGNKRTLGFFGLSGLLHAGAVIGATVFAGSLLIKPKMPEITEIQILSTPEAKPLAGTPAPEVAPPPAPITAPVAPSAVKEVVPVQKVTEVKRPSALPVKVAKPTSTSQKSITSANAGSKPVAAPNFETAELDSAPAVVTPAFSEDMVDDDLAAAEAKSNQQTAAEVAALQKQSNDEIEQAEREHAESLEKIKQQHKEEADRMAALAAAERNRQAAAIAAKTKAEAAEAEAAARAEAAAQAKAQAAAVVAAQGTGNGGNGGDVRGIQDLKQKPGNKRPEYDHEDRFQGRQGEVVFMAYVTKDGSLTNFQLMKSSGHRTLDLKTLKALKDWKFYPGQEGSVEIPFQWDLKGGPQEMPTGLRTKVSQSLRPADLRANN